MAADTGTKGDKKSREKKPIDVTFKCRFCKETKPISEMVIVSSFFPPVVACRECEKEIR